MLQVKSLLLYGKFNSLISLVLEAPRQVYLLMLSHVHKAYLYRTKSRTVSGEEETEGVQGKGKNQNQNQNQQHGHSGR